MEEQRQPLTIAQRQAKARQMKRLAPRLARFRKMKAKRMADREQILKRAQKAARTSFVKKLRVSVDRITQHCLPQKKSPSIS